MSKFYIYYNMDTHPNPYITVYQWSPQVQTKYHLQALSDDCYSHSLMQIDLTRKILWHKINGEKIEVKLHAPSKDKTHLQLEGTEIEMSKPDAWGEVW